jgi:hypothetical protein
MAPQEERNHPQKLITVPPESEALFSALVELGMESSVAIFFEMANVLQRQQTNSAVTTSKPLEIFMPVLCGYIQRGLKQCELARQALRQGGASALDRVLGGGGTRRSNEIGLTIQEARRMFAALQQGLNDPKQSRYRAIQSMQSLHERFRGLSDELVVALDQLGFDISGMTEAADELAVWYMGLHDQGMPGTRDGDASETPTYSVGGGSWQPGEPVRESSDGTRTAHAKLAQREGLAGGLRVDMAELRVFLNDVGYTIGDKRPLLILQRLMDAKGQWMAGSVLAERMNPLLRVDRILKRLPSEITSLIESRRGLGYRLSQMA